MEENNNLNEEVNNIEVQDNTTDTVVEETPKKKSKTGLIVVIVLLLICLGIGAFFLLNKKEEPKDKEKETKTETKDFKSAYRMSGNGLENFDLYFLKLENNGKNMIYSPLSIKYTLEMLKEGTDGDSYKQIDAVVGDYVGAKYNNNKNMSFANGLFVRDTYKNNISADYVNTLKTKYNAEVIYDSFASPKALNDWVSNKTFKLINNAVDNLDDKDFVIVNSLAIDMEWINKIRGKFYIVEYEHEKYPDTWIEEFRKEYDHVKFKDGKTYNSLDIDASANRYDIISDLGEQNIYNTVSAEYEKWLKTSDCVWEETPGVSEYMKTYMSELKKNYKFFDKSTDFSFYADDDVKVFAKDLKTYDGITLQYVGIMPKKVELKEYINNVDANKLSNIVNNLKEVKYDTFEEGYITHVYGTIPVFKYNYNLDLIKDLNELGITDIFDPTKANLSKLTTDSAYINDASHKSMIEFSNNGIKAASFTEMGGMGNEDCPFVYDFDVPVKNVDLTFDNPYMYIIRNKDTGEVWFVGTVYEPELAK